MTTPDATALALAAAMREQQDREAAERLAGKVGRGVRNG